MEKQFPFRIPKNLQERVREITIPDDSASGENYLIFFAKPWLFDEEYGTVWWVESKAEAIDAIKSAYRVSEEEWENYNN